MMQQRFTSSSSKGSILFNVFFSLGKAIPVALLEDVLTSA